MLFRNRKSINFELLKNYIILFIVLTIVFIISSAIVLNISSYFEEQSPESDFLAVNFLTGNYDGTRVDTLVNYGGGLQVINEAKEILISRGRNPFNEEQLTEQAFVSFVAKMNAYDHEYQYDLAYNNDEAYWVLINYPIDFEIRFFIKRNENLNPIHSNKVNVFILTALSIYFFIFLIGLIIYSRFSSKIFVNPLKTILEGVNKMISGDFGSTIEIHANKEFEAIGEAFNEMSHKINNEQQLRKQAEENRKRLVMDIAHDLKNPLASIMGYSEYILNEQTLNDEALKKYLEIINENSKRSNQLINDLFEYSKLDSQAYHLNVQTIDFCEYLRTLISTKITVLEDNGFIYDFKIPNHEISLTFDPELMNRALLNIINNAIKYNPKGTKLTIELKEYENKITLIIMDDGIGIDDSIKDNIFQPFTRDHHELNQDSTGLGLAIAEKIIKKHQGTIQLDQNFKDGTKFIIKLKK